MKVDETKLPARTAAQALATIRSRTGVVPYAAVVLGSGVSALSELIDTQTLSFEEVFGVAPTISGHAGTLVIGQLPDNPSQSVAVFRGRFHLYEGHPWSVVTLPTKMLMDWGVPRLILTNAAGGLNPHFSVGDLMVMTGFRDFISEDGRQHMIERLKRPPVDCRSDFSEQIFRAGTKLSQIDKDFWPLKSGIYAGFTGPSYETLAEIAMIRSTGCDAVGMSTIPDFLTAKGSSLEVAALSVITNVWRDDIMIGGHEEVLAASKAASTRLDKLLKHLLGNST